MGNGLALSSVPYRLFYIVSLSLSLSISTASLQWIPAFRMIQIAQEFPPFLRIYKDGRIERLRGTGTVPTSMSGLDDPHINPTAEGAPRLRDLICGRVLVCVAEKDMLRERGWNYYHALASSGWEGVLEMMETEDEQHVFHLFNPTCENAQALIKRVAAFLILDQACGCSPEICVFFFDWVLRFAVRLG